MSGSAARTVTIRLAVQDDDVRRKLEELGQKGDVSLRQIEKAANDASPAMTRLGSVTDGVARSMGGFGAALTSPTAAITALVTGAGAAAVAIAKIGDEMVNTQARLTAATGTAQAAAAVMGELVKLGQQTGVSVAESAGAFARFSIAAREVGATNAQVLALVRTVQQAGIIAGASTQETTSTVLQLGQALASGRLQGDELRAVMESMPNLAEALARALNVSVGRLREMGTEGKLTADVVMNGLGRAGERINEQFNQMPVTMGRAFDILGVSMTNFVGRLDQALGLSQAIARAAQAAAAAVGGLTAAITPNTPGQQAAADVAAAEARRARLQIELDRLSGEPGYYSQPRRGSLSAGLQGTAVGQTQSSADRIAEIRAQIDAENRTIEQGLERRNAIARQETEVGEAEEATANARRNNAARQAATTAFNTTRDSLDRERKLREDHRARIEVLDRAVIARATTETEATRLRNLANRELEEGLKKLTEGQGRNNEAQREANDLLREYGMLRRDASGLLVANDSESRAIQGIQRDIRGTDADPEKRRRDAEKIAQDQRREAQRAAQEIERDNRRVTDSIVNYGASAFSDMFSKNSRGWKGMLETFQATARSVFARIAAEAIIRPIVAPIVQGLGLGSLGSGGGGFSLGGISGGGGLAAGTPGSGIMGQFGNMGSSQTIMRGLNGFNPGDYMSGSTAFNTGWGGLDSVLNTSLWGTSAATQMGATNAALGCVDSYRNHRMVAARVTTLR